MMIYLKCTGDVQKAIGLRKENLADALPSEAPLGNWYVHRFDLTRGQAYIFMSEATLLSFILFQGKNRYCGILARNVNCGAFTAA